MWPWKKESAEIRALNDALISSANSMSQLLAFARGGSVTPVTPLEAAGVATVFACVDAIASAVSTLPIHLYRRSGRNKERVRNSKAMLISERPNFLMNSVEFREAMTANLLIFGFAPAEIGRDETGEPVDLTLLLPPDVELIQSGSQQYNYQTKAGIVPRQDMMVIKARTLDGLTGRSCTAAFGRTIDLAAEMLTVYGKFFSQGLTLNGMFVTPNKLTPTQASELRDHIKKKNIGIANAFNPMVLENGMDFKTIAPKFLDAQFHETRVYQDKQIARAFRVPHSIIGIEGNQPRANVEQEGLNFLRFTLLPWLVKWEAALNDSILNADERADGYYFRFQAAGLMRADTATRYQSYRTGIETGFLSVNEVRELEDLDPIEAGDEHYKPLNMGTVNGN